MGREFLPPFTEGTLTVNVSAQPGISLEASNAIGQAAEQSLLALPDVASTGRRTGRAELDDHAEGVHYTEIDVVLGPSQRSREEVLQAVRSSLASLQGVTINVGQPISHRLDHILSGIQAQVAIKLFGPDLERLRSTAKGIEDAIREVPGVVDVAVEQQTLIPQIQIRIDRAAAARYGLQVAPTNQLLETALNGRVVSQAIDETKRIDLVVRLDEPFRTDIGALQGLLIDGPDGTKVPLSTVAQVSSTSGPNQILRENALRRIVVQCNTAGRDLGSVIADIQRVVGESVTLEPGYFIEYGGQFESQQQATRLIGLLSVISILLIFGALYGHFGSARLAFQVMASIPLAIIGGVIAIFLSGGTLSVASLVGFITSGRHQCAQQHHDAVALPPSDEIRRGILRREDDRARFSRAAGAGSDDRAHDRTGNDPARVLRWRRGKRDPAAGRHRHPRRTRHRDPARSDFHARAVLQVRLPAGAPHRGVCRTSRQPLSPERRAGYRGAW